MCGRCIGDPTPSSIPAAVLHGRARVDIQCNLAYTLRLSVLLVFGHFLLALSSLSAQSPFSTGRQSVLFSNGLSGGSESWISLLAPSGLSTSYRLILPTTAPSVNQLLSVSSISGSDYTMVWTNASNITGSGSATQVAYWSGTSTLSSNSNLYWDNTNKRLGVGTSSPSAQIHSVVTNSSSSLTSLTNANRTLLCENTTTNGTVGLQFIAKNSGGTARKVNMGIDVTLAGTNTVFGIIPDGVSDGGMIIDNVNGNVEIGSTLSGSSVVNKLSVNGNLSVGSGYRETSAPSDGAIIQGDVGIGTSSPSNRLTVYNGSTTGNYTTSGWTHSSDARLKTDIHPILNAMVLVRAMQGVRFHWINRPQDPEQIGFIAQQVEPVLPEVVSTDAQGMKSLAYSNITALHNEAIKELDDRLRAVESQEAMNATEVAREQSALRPQVLHNTTISAAHPIRIGQYVIQANTGVKIEATLHFSAVATVHLQFQSADACSSPIFVQTFADRQANRWIRTNETLDLPELSEKGVERTMQCEGVIENPYDHPLSVWIMILAEEEAQLLDGSLVEYTPISFAP